MGIKLKKLGKISGMIAYILELTTLRLCLTRRADDVHYINTLNYSDRDQLLQAGQNWLNKCQEEHGECSRKAGPLPARLVTVEKDKCHFSLSTSLPQGTKYATLSHCWGDLDLFRLHKSNLNSLL